MIFTKHDFLSIVLPADATTQERFAAEELKKYLHAICGVTSAITDTPNGRSIFIGETRKNGHKFGSI